MYVDLVHYSLRSLLKREFFTVGFSLSAIDKSSLIQTLLGVFKVKTGTITLGSISRKPNFRVSFLQNSMHLPLMANNVLEYLKIMSHFRGVSGGVMSQSIFELAIIFKATHLLERFRLVLSFPLFVFPSFIMRL